MTSGALSLAIDPVRTAVAASISFQSRVGAADTADALHHVHYYVESLGELLRLARPLAIVSFTEHGFHQIASGPTLMAAGDIAILFSDNSRVVDDNESYIDFTDFVGDVLDDLVATGSLDATFAEFELLANQLPIRTPRSERSKENDYWIAEYVLSYGEGN